MLRDVETEASIGLHAWERHPERPTRLIVNVDLYARGTRSVGEDGAPLIDYDPIRRAIRDWRTRPHTPLLEMLAEELAALCFAQPHVAACRVSVVKPDIFNDAAGAGVELFRYRS